MKKLFFTGLLLLLLQASGFSQRFYVRAGGGYAWPSGSQHMASNYQVDYNMVANAFTETFTNKSGSYGAGKTANLALGYRFTDQLSLEGGFSYLAGKTYPSQENYTGSFTGSLVSETYARMPALSMAAVITASGAHWRPYAKAGVVVGQARIYNQDRTVVNNDNINREWEINGKKVWGFQGGLGMQYAITAQWGLFLEGIFRSMSFTPEKGKVTRYEENGQDQYHSLSVRQRELEYKASYTLSSNNQRLASQPSQISNDPVAFSSAGLQLGVQLNLR